MGSIAELFADLGLNVREDQWNHANDLIERASKGVEDLSKQKREAHKEEMSEGSELSEMLEAGLESFVGYEGLRSLKELVEHTVEATIEAKHLGERLGITTAAVQELGYAADVTGSSSAALQSGLQRLAFGLQSTGEHAGGAAEALAKYHINANELRKLPLDQQLSVIADKFTTITDAGERVALSMKLFGRGAGPELVPLLLKGSAGIAELRAEAERLGVTMSEEGVEKAEEFERAQKRLQARFTAVKNEIVVALLPALEAILSGFSRVVDFMRDHEEILIGVITAVAAAIVRAGISAALAWAPLLAPFAAFIAAVTIVVAIVVKANEYLGKTAKIILGIALAISLWFAPLTAAVALITLIASNWDGVVDGVADFWEAFKATVDSVWGTLKRTASAVGDWFADLPVIKQLIELYHLVTGGTPGAAEAAHTEETKRETSVLGDSPVAKGIMGAFSMGQSLFPASPERVTPSSAAPTTINHTTVTGGNITINTGAHSEEVIEQIRKSHEDLWRQTHAATKKGG